MPSTRTPKELKGDIQKAVQILELFTDPSKGRDVKMLIPANVLKDAHGIVFIRLYRIGFMLSAKGGTGIIIARLPDGSWSAPSGVSMSSVGFGHQAGGEVIDSIIVMNYRAAVKAFFDGGGQLQLGVGASLAVGPLGRAADISASASNTSHIAATYAYSSSKGLYIGYSFEGSKISERVNTNAAYYGRPISAREILTGVVPPSQDAARLYDLLNSMGAGPRPGLPFASQRDKKAQSLSMHNSPTTTTTTPPPPINYANRPPTTSDGFEEPPPPYQPDDGPSQPKHNESSSFNQTYMNQPNTFPTDTKSPIIPIEPQHTASFHRPDMQPGQAASYYHHSSPFDAPSGSKGKHHSTTRDMQPESSAPPAAVSQYNDTKQPLPTTNNDIMTVVVAKYDYHSDSPSDLNFSAGDHIIVTKRLDDRQSWWEGEIGEKRGFFPANYTEELT
ncbi:hypothetical protein HPULCUR_006672 [Helicostylum pulchrum]|uniref:SH3 domain-containing protein n=1 Tax=Helicostylum pulchrum TaxID=562976 RepID=A0ABP9Y343_9FUNG